MTPAPPGEDSGLTVAVARAAATDVRETTSAAVRWGGTIVSVDNGEDGRATLEIVARPLGANGRPIHNDVSDGRFLAVFDRVLDPQIVKTGRDMTVTGTVTGVREGRIDAAPYRFPLVRVSDHRYWRPAPIAAQVDDACHTRWANHGFGYHQHDPFYCGSPFAPRRGDMHGPWFDDWPHPWPRPSRDRHPPHQ